MSEVKKCPYCADKIYIQGKIDYDSKEYYWGKCFKCGYECTVEEFDNLEQFT